MNFFSPLTARDFPAFDIIENAFDAKGFAFVYDNIIRNLEIPDTPNQTGARLNDFTNLPSFFRDLERKISQRAHQTMHLRLDKSSYRLQHPGGFGRLGWHQDVAALEEVRQINPLIEFVRGPRPYMSKPHLEPACTVWVPLVDVDGETPSLEISSWFPLGPLAHERGPSGYSVLVDQAECERHPSFSLMNMSIGSGVILTPLTIHRTCVRPWHIKIRTSLDLRFLPTRSSNPKRGIANARVT